MINFLPRLISGILYILIIFTSIIISKESFLLVFSITTLVVSYEAYLLYKKMKKNDFYIWGTGKPKREFLYSEDLAEAIHFIIKNEIEIKLLKY